MTHARRHFARGVVAFGLGPAIGVVTAPILARALGPAGRGQLAAILQPLTLADALAVFGLPAAITYFTARGADFYRVERMARRVVVVSSLTVFGLVAAYAWPVARAQGLDPVLLMTIWASVIPGAVIAVRRARLAGQQRWRLLDAERASAALGRLATITSLAWIGATSVYAYAASPIAWGLISSLVLLFVLPGGHRAHKGGNTPRSGTILRFAGLASFSVVLSAANARVDQALFAANGASEEVGYYAAAVAIAEIPLVIAMLLQRNIGSEVAAGVEVSQVSRTLKFGIASTVGTALFLEVVAPHLVPLAFGAEFGPSTAVARILLVGILGTCAMMVCGAILSGLGRPGRAAVPFALSALIVMAWFLLVTGNITAIDLAIVSSSGQVLGGLLAVTLVARLWRRGHSESNNQTDE